MKIKLLFLAILLPQILFAQDLMTEFSSKLQAIQGDIRDYTIHQTGQMMLDGDTLSTEVRILKKGVMFRVDQKYGDKGSVNPMLQMMRGIKLVSIYDGVESWLIGPDGQKQKLPIAALPTLNLDYLSLLSKVERVSGLQTLGNQSCYVFETDTPNGQMRFYVDRQTLAPVMAEGGSPLGLPMTIKFDDVRTVTKKWKYPYRIVMELSDIPFSITQIKSIKVNTNLPDTVFHADKASFSLE